MGEALRELLPRKARLTAYVVTGLGATALAVYQAAEGNWVVFAAGVLGSLTSVLAAGNITPAGDE